MDTAFATVRLTEAQWAVFAPLFEKFNIKPTFGDKARERMEKLIAEGRREYEAGELKPVDVEHLWD